jgi:hypothetical protein
MGITRAFAFNKALKFADAGCRVMDLKSEIVDAATKQAKAARKVMLKTRDTAEEFVNTAVFAIKKHPMKALCCTFGTAFTIGAVAGWLGKRSR